MKKYVLGFLFSEDLKYVVLIKKINPKWQRGLLNGVGGKIEDQESSSDAMVREFKEETGVLTEKQDWHCFAKINRPNFYEMDIYCAFSNFAFDAKSVEKEEVFILEKDKLPNNIIPNLRWLIPLALDKQVDFSRPVLINEISKELK
ncbi:NUDIX hydrolase [Halarcobacter anaerophilus]|uniref:Nudix hydrolase domain-containing protein n=1 Tax=Halarcobacter anaerophilus TaxID=877500 RepID=A0A4Q0Y390_9BACT|nr:NUDIX domain-containing protein [Halarcobacter anaerophilus]QDF29314.1 hypothetical protein AANAER_1840 [Halarcobacter anaerophilus]RXJ64562.1 hypothetical protein CRV06_00985 [Halarcobacter anaerophilus]